MEGFFALAEDVEEYPLHNFSNAASEHTLQNFSCQQMSCIHLCWLTFIYRQKYLMFIEYILILREFKALFKKGRLNKPNTPSRN